MRRAGRGKMGGCVTGDVEFGPGMIGVPFALGDASAPAEG